jgi:ferritin-like metal-binding protein YciE
MSDKQLREKLVGYTQDAHAMEQNVLSMLDSMISTSKEPETVARLKQHRQETERHERLLRERLEDIGDGRSYVADAAAVAGAMLKGVMDQMRVDKPGKNARDAYITEHTEIAAYELLERLAERAGDTETAQMARTIRADEERMAKWIASRWDQFVDETLSQAGLHPAQVIS